MTSEEIERAVTRVWWLFAGLARQWRYRRGELPKPGSSDFLFGLWKN